MSRVENLALALALSNPLGRLEKPKTIPVLQPACPVGREYLNLGTGLFVGENASYGYLHLVQFADETYGLALETELGESVFSPFPENDGDEVEFVVKIENGQAAVVLRKYERYAPTSHRLCVISEELPDPFRIPFDPQQSRKLEG